MIALLLALAALICRWAGRAYDDYMSLWEGR